MSKSKPVEVWIQLLVVAAVISAGSFYMLNKDRRVTAPLKSVPEEEFTYAEASAKDLVDTRYPRLGFIIGLPVSVDVEGAKVSFFADGKSPAVYISPTQSGDDRAVTFAGLEESGAEWKMHVGEAHTDKELLAFLHRWWQPGCEIKTETRNAFGQYDVALNDEGVDSPVCGSYGQYKIKYAPAYGKAAWWMIGQDHHFVSVSSANVVTQYDEVMADSFRFFQSGPPELE